MFKLAWWKDESNVKGANAIVGFLKVVVPLVVVSAITVAGWFGYQFQQGTKPKAAAPAPAITPAPASSVTTITADNGGAVQTGSGTQVVTGSNSSVTIGFSEEAFFTQLNAREAQLRADLTRASDAERDLVERQLQAVSAQKADVDAAYKQAVTELEALRARLARFEGQVGETQLAAAQKAIGGGDRNAADQVFSQVASNPDADAKLAAEAAFARGQIAEQEFRWADAADFYARAAELDPNFDNLAKAREFAWRSADTQAALQFGAQLLNAARAGSSPRDLAFALNAYGLSLNEAGQFAASRDRYQEAVDIAARTLGETNPEYADYVSNLAEAYHDLEEYDRAEELYRKVIEIDRATTGTQTPYYAINVQSLADLLYEMERFTEAKLYYAEAYQVRSAVLEEGHPDMAESLSSMAYVLWEEDKIDEARDYYRRAVALTDRALGPDHPRSIEIRREHDEFIAEEGE